MSGDSYGYDATNRLTDITYTDGTPAVHYDFDAAGRLTQAKSGNVINGFPSYDPDGRPFQSNVQIGGQTYTFNYHWDLAGNLLTETYPSGRVLTFKYDGASRARSVTGVLGGTSTPYVNQTVYWPSGAVNYWQYGNNVWPAEFYTPLLQPANSWTTIGNTGNTYQLYTQNYWNANGTVGGSEECFGPTVPWNNLSCFGQSYTYDNLNRLTAAYDSNYSRSFQSDEFGNMSLSTNYGLPLSGLTPMTNASPFDRTTNHVNGNANDARGNTTQIGTGVGVSYDAENRQIQTMDANTGLTINYVYDGLGQRVEQQVAGGVTTIFVHDALGQLAAKYNNAGVTPPCTTCYLSYDQLGSVRLITDQDGSVVGRHDYLPFGEEIPSGWAGRGAGDMFGVSANVTQMFTAQERDGGSATLDYFNARHLSAVLERFTQPDPLNAGADILNPQSWNGYGYVLGNPLGNVDPSGSFAVAHRPCDNYYCVIAEYFSTTLAGLLQQNYGGHGGNGGQSSSSKDPGPSRQKPPQKPGPCPNVPATPPGESIDANINATTKEPVTPTYTFANDVSGAVAAGKFRQWFDNICCWTSVWNYNAQGAQYDDSGNFNFGATGKALGLPDSVLMWGGGLKKNLDYWSKGEANPYWNQPYMNDPNKMNMIAQGIQYVQNGCNH